MKEIITTILISKCLATIISCTGKADNEKVTIKIDSPAELNIADKDVYDDIDLFDLKGINKIATPLDYPYIKIDSTSKWKKRLVYKISEKDSVERYYTLESNYWTTSFDYKTDTGFSRVYEYISPKRIIELSYNGTYRKTNYHLHDVSLIENNEEIVYSFFGEKGIDIKPQIDNFDLVKNRATAVFTTKFTTANGTLLITSNSFDRTENKIFFTDTSCYQTNNHSWFWWRIFGSKTMRCK